jgi:hypothetical protein
MHELIIALAEIISSLLEGLAEIGGLDKPRKKRDKQGKSDKEQDQPDSYSKKSSMEIQRSK